MLVKMIASFPSPSLDLRRIGCVPYLNARPLIYGLEDRVRLAVPSLLATELRAGRLDIALIPIAEPLEHPYYRILPRLAIGCRGAVLSVYLAHRKPLADLKRVSLDPSSKTSNLLLQVLLRDVYGLNPQFVLTSSETDSDGKLLIGDPALAARENLFQRGWTLLDLGDAWHQATHLPFVFAAWALRQELEMLPYLDLLSEARARGLREREALIASQNLLSPTDARRYLSHHLAYDLGDQETEGILEFQRRCVRLGLIPKTSPFKLSS